MSIGSPIDLGELFLYEKTVIAKKEDV